MEFQETLDKLFKESQRILEEVAHPSAKVNPEFYVALDKKITSLGSDINALLEFQRPGYNEEVKNIDMIQELLSTYESATQELDELLQSDEQIKYKVNSESKKQLLQNQLCSSWLRMPINECSDFEYLKYLNILEDHSVEFKNYSLDSIKSKLFREIIKKTIVSFLNRQGGSIYLGIRDDTLVVGMNLSIPQMDLLKRKIISVKTEIVPSVGEKVRVDFMPVRQKQKWMSARWVVRVRVDQGELDELYYFDNSQNPYQLESYYREDGAVIRYKVTDFIAEKIDMSQGKNHKRWKELPTKFSLPHKEGTVRCMRQPLQGEMEALQLSKATNCDKLKCKCGQQDYKSQKENDGINAQEKQAYGVDKRMCGLEKGFIGYEKGINLLDKGINKSGDCKMNKSFKESDIPQKIEPLCTSINSTLNNSNSSINSSSNNNNNSVTSTAETINVTPPPSQLPPPPRVRFGMMFKEVVYGKD